MLSFLICLFFMHMKHQSLFATLMSVNQHSCISRNVAIEPTLTLNIMFLCSCLQANDAVLEPTSGSGLGAPPRATSSCGYRQGLCWCCCFWASRGLELLPVLSWTAPSSCFFWAGCGLQQLPVRALELLPVLYWTAPSSCCCYPQLQPAAATNLGPHGIVI